MKRISTILLAGVAAFALNATVTGLVPLAAAATTTMVGGAPMYPSKNIVQNAVNSKDHTTLVAAVKAAGLVQTLESAGPFTVFAPTNDAFAKLPDGTVATLLKPENKQTLTRPPHHQGFASAHRGRGRQGGAENGAGWPADNPGKERQALGHRRQGRHRRNHHQ